MKLCFLIYHYFPYGGQQRDFLRIASSCIKRGHQVSVYTLRWQGEMPAGFDVTLVPVKSASRLKLYQKFTEWVVGQPQFADHDLVIGFNKMPHLDVYFAADSCFAEKAETQRGSYYKYTPRFRHFMDYEQAVFGSGSDTQVMVLSPLQKQAYLDYYQGCESRLHLVPPGIGEDRQVEVRDESKRQSLRDELSVADDELLLLQVGSGFKIKGVDRALRSIAALPDSWRRKCRYVLVGQGKPSRFLRLAKKLGLAEQVQVLSGRDDIPRFFAGADLLLHPAYQESAGYTLLEATIAGLPVLTTASCGYAFHIEQAQVGEVCSEPFQQEELDQRLLSMLERLNDADWSGNGLAYGKNPELYSLGETATDLLEQFGEVTEH